MPRRWDHVLDETPDVRECPDCGAPILGGRGACRAFFHSLNAATGGPPRSLRTMRLMTDCYALQHLDPFCRTAKELIYHLTSLCCGLEYDGSPAIYRALQQSVDGVFTGERPVPPGTLGAFTVLHLRGITTAEDLERRVDEWAQTIWQAWSVQQDAARGWIRQHTRSR